VSLYCVDIFFTFHYEVLHSCFVTLVKSAVPNTSADDVFNLIFIFIIFILTSDCTE